jgi:1-acyl-sn-glycerol-3-phosphate acyltransferase
MSAIVHPAATLLASMAKCLTGADVRWLWRPVEPRPRVYFANHSSHLDALVIWAALPAPVRMQTRPVAAQEYWQRSRWRSYLATRVFRSVLVPRAGSSPFAGRGILSSLLHELERGCSLILFPEGGRGDGREIAPFKSGLYQLCQARSGLEAVPVYLENLNRVLPKGNFVPAPSTGRVVFGPPLRLGAGETKPDFLSRAEQALRALRPR